jgi:hypothetical protein
MRPSKEPNYEELLKVRKLMQGSPPNETRAAWMRRVSGHFPDITARTLEMYACAMSASSYLYGLFEERKISYGVLYELMSMRTDDATRDFIGRAVMERGFSTAQLSTVKRLLRKGCSTAEALAKAAGEIPEKPVKAERAAHPDTFNDEIMKLGTQWRMKVQMAMDLLPATTLEGGTAKAAIFKKAYELRHLVREQLAFIDAKVEQFLKEIETHAAARSAAGGGMSVMSVGGVYEYDPGDHGHGEVGEAEVSPVGTAQPPVQDPAQDAGR